MNEIIDRILDLVDEMSIDTICKEIQVGDLRSFVQNWQHKMVSELQNLEEGSDGE